MSSVQIYSKIMQTVECSTERVCMQTSEVNFLLIFTELYYKDFSSLVGTNRSCYIIYTIYSGE